MRVNGQLIVGDWLMTSAREEARARWGVRVHNGKIADVAPGQVLRDRYPQDAVCDASGHVVAPGFVNAHVHLYGVLAHGIPLEKAPAGFWAFLNDFWWPLVEDALDHEMICAATDYVCAEMLGSGITSFYDVLEAPNALPGALLAQKEVVERRGLRGVLSFEATERVGKENGQLGLRENADFIDLCQGEGGLVQGLMCFHTTFTCSATFIEQAFALAQERAVLTHCHCNESVHEPHYALEHFGRRTVEYYQALAVAGPQMMASQCVQLSERERAIIAETGIRCTHMPLSNCEVGGGIAPVPELMAAGVTMGLGSDGYINDFYEVMRGAFLIHKAHRRDPRAMPARDVWHLATEGGAQALGWDDVGRLAPGWAADLQVVEADFPTPLAAHNLAEQMLLWGNHTHVRDVMVAGKWRVRNGQVLDADLGALKARVQENARRMWAKTV